MVSDRRFRTESLPFPFDCRSFPITRGERTHYMRCHQAHAPSRSSKEKFQYKRQPKFIPGNYISVDEVTAALREAGSESSKLVLQIDFTKGNEWSGRFSILRKSRHFLNGTSNLYEEATIIGQTLSPFDDDKWVPCFGFGDPSAHDQCIFSFYPDDCTCRGFEEVFVRSYEDNFNKGTNDVEFSVSSSGNGSIAIKLGSSTVQVPKYCSVHRPIVQMVLFATMCQDTSSFLRQDTFSFWDGDIFHCSHSVMPKAILDSNKHSISIDVATVYKAGRVTANTHSAKSLSKGAISDARSRMVRCQIDRSNWLSLPVLFDVSTKSKSETLISKLPRYSKTREDGRACGFIQLICEPEDSDDSTWTQEAEERQFILKIQDQYLLVTTQSLTPGDGSSRPTGTMARPLYLDSGAGHHAVGDVGILCNLRDPPAGTAVVAADGARLPVAKVGDIQTPHIRIEDVYLVPGLEVNLVSVRQLAKSRFVTTFYENHAELWQDGELVGGAIADTATSLYRLYFMMATTDSMATTS